MSSSNENKVSYETPTKVKNKNTKFFDEVDLIASNQKISTTIDSSGVLEVNSKDTPTKISVNSTVSRIDSDLIYGAPIIIENPRKIGNMRAYLYINNFPLIVIGPDCK